MKTFLDVVQETDFRKKAQKKLSLGTAHPFYSFKNTFPIEILDLIILSAEMIKCLLLMQKHVS